MFTTTIYGIPDLLFPNHRTTWYIVPREVLERYCREHPRYVKELPKDFVIKEEEVTCYGRAGRNAFCEFKDGKTAFACTELIAGVDTPHLGYKANVPEMGPGARLILDLAGSDSGKSEIPLTELAQLTEVGEPERVEFLGLSPDGGYYAPKVINRIVVAGPRGKQAIYEMSVGYFEGYQYDLYRSLKSALQDHYDHQRFMKELKNTALECWECGAVYEAPGFVDEGQMSCARCR